jgi:hypothetical protein
MLNSQSGRKNPRRNWSAVPFEALPYGEKRKRLLEESNYSCTSCGFSKTRECGRTILEIDHVDGDSTNNAKENLRVLCPNCHALTPTFRNWGRPGQVKTSKRFRKGNVGFVGVFERDQASRNAARKMQNEIIVQATMTAHTTGVINFRKWGWVSKFNKYLTENHSTMFEDQTVGRKIRELMPDFYAQNCYKRL